MIDARAKQTHSIFVEALDRPADHRESFLEEACGVDTALKAEVERLLEAVEQSTDFLESPALGDERSARAMSAPTQPGRVAGYDIIRTLGVGGMASVYEAQQQSPSRRVALKVMHHALAKTGAQRRFEFETEVLARLKHPGIAQIYEAGTFADEHGQPAPYFTMELVEDAKPITRHADDSGLDLRARLSLFTKVCTAVRHGHQAGVIHRDLKPSNVLVDAQGHSKVIDFGIARSIGPKPSTITIDEDRHRLLGTLNYMSPEQCAGAERIDTRADVYALGVMLHELVTGRVPHDLSTASLPEAARIIEQVRPPRPSSILPGIESDLELIIITAIEKDPERRYPTASELAADVRRFLAHEPIQARPATALYQAKKFAQRHRTPVIAAAIVVLALIAGAITSTLMAVEANRARRAAEARERELEQVSEFHRSQLLAIDATEMGERLRASLTAALSQADSLAPQTAQAIELVNFTNLAMEVLDANIIGPSVDAIDEQFADRPLLQARLLQALASSMHRLGLSAEALPVLERALTIRKSQLGDEHPVTIDSTHALGSLHFAVGDLENALDTLESVYEKSRRILGDDDPQSLVIGIDLGGTYRYLGRLDDATRVWEETLARGRVVWGSDDRRTHRVLNNVGVAYAVRGDFDNAERAWRELLELRRVHFGEDHPAYQSTLTNLGMLLAERGDLEEGYDYIAQSYRSLQRAYGDEHPSTLQTLSSLAYLAAELETDDAIELHRASAAGRVAKLGAEHPDALRSRARLHAFLIFQDHQDASLVALREVYETQLEALGENHEDTIETTHLLARAMLKMSEPVEAQRLASAAISRADDAGLDNESKRALMGITLGRALTALGRVDEARPHLEAARDSLAQQFGDDHLRTRRAESALSELAD